MSKARALSGESLQRFTCDCPSNRFGHHRAGAIKHLLAGCGIKSLLMEMFVLEVHRFESAGVLTTSRLLSKIRWPGLKSQLMQSRIGITRPGARNVYRTAQSELYPVQQKCIAFCSTRRDD